MVTFPNGTAPGTCACFNASIEVDNTIEGEDVVTLVVSSTDAIVIENISLTIQDAEDIQGMYSIILSNQQNDCLFTAHAALTISLDSPEVQGREGDSVLVCANISGDIVLEIPVLAALTVNRTDELCKHKTMAVNLALSLTLILRNIINSKCG